MTGYINTMVPSAQRYPVSWRSFTIAATATPFVFAVAGVLGAGVGVFFTLGAAILGFPAYLLLGLPAAYFAIARFRNRKGRADVIAITLTGFVANAGSLPLAYLGLVLSGESDGQAADLALTYAGLGMVAAPVMALIFGVIYRMLIAVEARKSNDEKEIRDAFPA